MSPEPIARNRSAALLALLVAALVLVASETIYAWAERWQHPLDYLGLSAGLTVGATLALGLVAALLRLPAFVACTLWLGLAGGVIWGPRAGAFFVVAAALGAAFPCYRSASAARQGVLAALALACAIVKGPNLAERLGQKDVLLVESLSGALFVFLIVGPLAAGLARAARRASWLQGAAGTAVLTLLGLVISARPLLDRADGTRRLPPEGYAQSAVRVPGADQRPSVFLLVLDTVRADHLSVYGYGRDTTPELTRMVRERDNAQVYTRAFANGTWTVPSHASLFTGRLPSEHGAHFALDGSVRYGFGVRDEVPTLAEVMKASGYATLGGYANHWLRSVQGLSRGFERWLRSVERDPLPFVGEALRERFLPGVCWGVTKGGARADEVNATLLSVVEPWSQGSNPLFVFANYGDAHGPYAPPSGFRGRFAPSGPQERAEHLSLAHSRERLQELEARYDEEIAYLDHELGRLFADLDRRGLLEESWVFVTSDHGEAFGEHGILEHGTTVYDEVTRIPLIVFPPRGERLAPETGPVSLVDVAATIAAIGGGELVGRGRDLREAPGPDQFTAIEFYGDAVKAATLGAQAREPARAVLQGRHKLVAIGDEFHLFDIEEDEHEQVDFKDALPKVFELLKALLPEFGQPTFSSDSQVATPDTLDALRALGYGGDLPVEKPRLSE
jgi:arylsulfatase A-like enzyme